MTHRSGGHASFREQWRRRILSLADGLIHAPPEAAIRYDEVFEQILVEMWESVDDPDHGRLVRLFQRYQRHLCARLDSKYAGA